MSTERDRPADDVPDVGDGVVVDALADPVPEGEHRERGRREHAGGEREHERAAVLLQRRPVLLDAVEPVQRPLHLAHERRAR